MKFISLSLFVFISHFVTAQLVEVEDFGKNPGNLKMFVYKPSSISDTVKNIPMVIALHGCSQNAKEIHEQSDWKKLADKNNFMMIYPQQKRENNLNNCFNWFREKDQEGEKGELFSIREMMDYGYKNNFIDSTRVFVYGLSAGALMSVNLMANYPELIAGGAIFAGGPYKVASTSGEAMKAMMKPVDKTPEEWRKLIPNKDSLQKIPKLIIGHGLKDLVVNIHASYELVEQWCSVNNMDTTADETISSFANNQLITRIAYHNQNKEERIIFYTIAKTGHTLPIDPGKGERQGGKKGMFAADKDFFSTYYVAKDFGLLKEERGTGTSDGGRE